MKRQRFDWSLVLGDEAKSTHEVARLLGLSLPNARRYLRRAYYQLRLVRQRRGRVFYYATTEAWEKYLNKLRGEEECLQVKVKPIGN